MTFGFRQDQNFFTWKSQFTGANSHDCQRLQKALHGNVFKYLISVWHFLPCVSCFQDLTFFVIFQIFSPDFCLLPPCLTPTFVFQNFVPFHTSFYKNEHTGSAFMSHTLLNFGSVLFQRRPPRLSVAFLMGVFLSGPHPFRSSTRRKNLAFAYLRVPFERQWLRSARTPPVHWRRSATRWRTCTSSPGTDPKPSPCNKTSVDRFKNRKQKTKG